MRLIFQANLCLVLFSFLNFMLPLILQETLTASFNFYREGRLFQGMSCQKRLYKLISIHTVENRFQAYRSGCKLSNQGDRTVITVSAEHYKVWVELRAQAIAQPLTLPESQSSALYGGFNVQNNQGLNP